MKTSLILFLLLAMKQGFAQENYSFRMLLDSFEANEESRILCFGEHHELGTNAVLYKQIKDNLYLANSIKTHLYEIDPTYFLMKKARDSVILPICWTRSLLY